MPILVFVVDDKKIPTYMYSNLLQSNALLDTSLHRCGPIAYTCNWSNCMCTSILLVKRPHTYHFNGHTPGKPGLAGCPTDLCSPMFSPNLFIRLHPLTKDQNCSYTPWWHHPTKASLGDPSRSIDFHSINQSIKFLLDSKVHRTVMKEMIKTIILKK